MKNMTSLYARTSGAKKENQTPVSRIRNIKISQPLRSPADHILLLQRTIGNRAVQGLIKSGSLENKRWMEKTRGIQSRTPQLNADVEIVSTSLPQKTSMLSDIAEGGMDRGDSVEKIAQSSGGSGSGSRSTTPSCTYSITYANIRTPGCSGSRCGAKMIYDITKVTATGSGCPSTLKGLRITESVTTDAGCIPGAVTTGAGCPIGTGGTVTGCTDTYALCASAASYPSTGCTEIYTQKLYVGGVLAETRKITFKITRSGSACSGTATRT